MAAINPLRKQGGGAEETFRAQSNVENVISGISNAIILDGVYLENVAVGTSLTRIEHKLNRAYRGYIVCNSNQFSQIRTVSTTNTKLFLELQASAACVVSLWVF